MTLGPLAWSGRIFMTGLTIMGCIFIRVTQWGRTFSGFWVSENSGM